MKNNIANIERKIVSMLLPWFLYWIELKIINPTDVIKNHTAGISPSIEPIIFIFKLLTLKITWYITSDN